MDIFNYIKKDHRKVDDLFKQLLNTKDRNERLKLFDEIKHELLIHNRSEQKTFYKALEDKKDVSENIEEGEEEHEEIEKYIKVISKLDPATEEWMEQIGEFKHAVTHHVKEEEENVFPKAKKILSDKQANELTAEMDGQKQKEAKKLN